MIAPAMGAPPDAWIRIAPGYGWVDKPRWSPDCRTIYFLSRRNSAYFNLWGVRFDRERGRPVGEPFAISHFESRGRMISPDMGNTETGISANRALLTLATVKGNIWMLDNVDQ